MDVLLSFYTSLFRSWSLLCSAVSLHAPGRSTLFSKVRSSEEGKRKQVIEVSCDVHAAMDSTQMKSVSHSKTSEGSASQHRSHSSNNDFSEDGYSEDKVCSTGTLQIICSHHLLKFATISLRKTAKISWYYHWFPHKMTSEKRLQKVHTQLHDNASLSRSGQRYWLAEANFSGSMTNQKHYPDLGSNSSLIQNFCICFSDIIWGKTMVVSWNISWKKLETCYSSCKMPHINGYCHVRRKKYNNSNTSIPWI